MIRHYRKNPPNATRESNLRCRARDDALTKITGGLRGFTDAGAPRQHPLKDAHAPLDAAVLKAYGFSAKKDLVKQLLDLNYKVAACEAKGDSITAPDVPKGYPQPEKLVTTDCIKPAE